MLVQVVTFTFLCKIFAPPPPHFKLFNLFTKHTLLFPKTKLPWCKIFDLQQRVTIQLVEKVGGNVFGLIEAKQFVYLMNRLKLTSS